MESVLLGNLYIETYPIYYMVLLLVQNISVSYIMDVKTPFLEPNYKVTRAREIMRVTGARVLPVINNKYERRLLGIVTRLEILSVTSTKSELKVKDIMTQPPLIFDENLDVVLATKQMLSKDEWYVPVVKGEEYQGMLGLENIIMWLLYHRSTSDKNTVKVEEVMSRDVVFVKQDDLLTKVWYLMLKHRYGGLPVVNEKNKVVGIITQYDILSKGKARIRLESESDPLRIPVKEVMNRPVITVLPKDPIELAGEIMVRRNIGRLVVTDEAKSLIGIIDRADVLRGLLRW